MVRSYSLQQQKERDHVRHLAEQVAEIAASPENEAIMRRWRNVNALRRPDRSPVWCRPVGCWPELLPEDSLICQDPWLRAVERGFRQILIKHDINDDSPVDSFFPVNAAFDWDPPNIWGVDISRHQPGVTGGAWAFDPPLKTELDFDRLKMPTVIYNKSETEKRLERAEELLGDILPVRLVCGPPLSATLGTAAAHLRGLTEMMMDMVLRPELMHRLMGFLRDATLKTMKGS